MRRHEISHGSRKDLNKKKLTISNAGLQCVCKIKIDLERGEKHNVSREGSHIRSLAQRKERTSFEGFGSVLRI